jgi:hypothetical protein
VVPTNDPGLQQERAELLEIERRIERTQHRLSRFEWAAERFRRFGGNLAYVERAIATARASVAELEARRARLLKTIEQLQQPTDEA